MHINNVLILYINCIICSLKGPTQISLPSSIQNNFPYLVYYNNKRFLFTSIGVYTLFENDMTLSPAYPEFPQNLNNDKLSSEYYQITFEDKTSIVIFPYISNSIFYKTYKKSTNYYNSIQWSYDNSILSPIQTSQYNDKIIISFVNKSGYGMMLILNSQKEIEIELTTDFLINDSMFSCRYFIFIQKIACVYGDTVNQIMKYVIYEEDRGFGELTILGTIKEHGCNVEEVKGTEFDTAFGNKIGIISIDLVNKNDIIVNNKKYDSTNQINKFSHDDLIVEFNNIVKPLYQKDSLIKHWCWTDKRNIDSVKRKEEDSKSNKWFVNVASIRGNKGTDDMYTIIPRDRKVEFGERTLNFYINFDTKEEGENFINYCKTDFASMCIYFHKEDINLGTNLHYVPWFDFSDEHFSKSPREIDDWLFKKYNISDEIRKHIEEILPDYYSIR